MKVCFGGMFEGMFWWYVLVVISDSTHGFSVCFLGQDILLGVTRIGDEGSGLRIGGEVSGLRSGGKGSGLGLGRLGVGRLPARVIPHMHYCFST